MTPHVPPMIELMKLVHQYGETENRIGRNQDIDGLAASGAQRDEIFKLLTALVEENESLKTEIVEAVTEVSEKALAAFNDRDKLREENAGLQAEIYRVSLVEDFGHEKPFFWCVFCEVELDSVELATAGYHFPHAPDCIVRSVPSRGEL